MASASATTAGSTYDFVEVVRSKIVELFGNAPTSSARGIKLKQTGQKVLDRSCDTGIRQESFDNLLGV